MASLRAQCRFHVSSGKSPSVRGTFRPALCPEALDLGPLVVRRMRCRWVWQGPQASQRARVRRAFGKRVRRPVCAPVACTWLMKSRPNPWKANSCVFYAGIYFIFSWTFPRCRTPCLRNNNNNSKRLHNWPIRERGVGAHVTAVAAPPGAGASPWCHPETVGWLLRSSCRSVG